jgi:hypothetical protein
VRVGVRLHVQGRMKQPKPMMHEDIIIVISSKPMIHDDRFDLRRVPEATQARLRKDGVNTAQRAK